MVFLVLKCDGSSFASTNAYSPSGMKWMLRIDDEGVVCTLDVIGADHAARGGNLGHVKSYATASHLVQR